MSKLRDRRGSRCPTATRSCDWGYPGMLAELRLQKSGRKQEMYVDRTLCDLPTLPFPKRRPLPLVDEDGGGGFWIWLAVGARDWRIE